MFLMQGTYSTHTLVGTDIPVRLVHVEGGCRCLFQGCVTRMLCLPSPPATFYPCPINSHCAASLPFCPRCDFTTHRKPLFCRSYHHSLCPHCFSANVITFCPYSVCQTPKACAPSCPSSPALAPLPNSGCRAHPKPRSSSIATQTLASDQQAAEDLVQSPPGVPRARGVQEKGAFAGFPEDRHGVQVCGWNNLPVC